VLIPRPLGIAKAWKFLPFEFSGVEKSVHGPKVKRGFFARGQVG